MTKPLIDSGSRMRHGRNAQPRPYTHSPDVRSSKHAGSVACACVACCLQRVYSASSNHVGTDSAGSVERWSTLGRGRSLFRADEPFHAVFLICTGSAKTIVSYENGPEQVTGFHIAGELVGISAFGTQYYPCTAIALEPTTLCQLPVGRLQGLGDEDPLLQHDLLALLGRQIAWDYQLLVSTLGKKNAAQRTAAFIINMWRRYAERGADGPMFPSPMSRSDIGSYLGLSRVTLGQILTNFERRGLITLGRSYITLRMPEQLLDIAELPRSWHYPSMVTAHLEPSGAAKLTQQA